MKKVKVLSLLLALVMIASVFAACGQQAADPTAAPNNDTPATATPQGETPAEKVQLTLGIYPVDPDEAQKAEHDKFIAAFNEKYPDVEVVKANYEYALDTFFPLAESGNLPVVFTTWYTEPKKIAAAGYAADITDYLEERGWLDKINPGILELMTYEGRVYGIPRDAYQLGLMINLAAFEAAGYKNEDGTYQYPKTWEEVAEYAVAIKAATGQQAIAMQGQDNGAGWHFSNIAWNFGAELTTTGADGLVKANLNTPEFIAALEFVKSLRWEHDVLMDASTINWGTGFEAVSTGTAAMYIAANDGANQPLNYGMSKDGFAIIPMPAGPGGQYQLNGGTPYMFSADATPDQINAALNYLEIMGRVPMLNDETQAGWRTTQQNNNEQGIPVIPNFPLYTDPAILAAQDAIVEEFSNVDMRLWQPFVDALRSDAAHAEEPYAQEMYSQILLALQAIFSDPNADCANLAQTANDNYQALLDDAQAN
jgi:ABC-type glycerol-3-phosphate transport system substrate-binding protein